MARTEELRRNNSRLTFRSDSDSFTIGVDTHASYCMSNNKSHFVGSITPVGTSNVIGVKGTLPIRGTGTVVWKLNDDEGRTHVFKIHSIIYVPGLKNPILSPQHWADQVHANDHTNAWEVTRRDTTTLYWNDGETKRTIPMSKGINTLMVLSSQGANQYRLFEAVFNANHQPEITACASVYDDTYEQECVEIIRDTSFPNSNLDDMVQQEDSKLSMSDPKAELLWWHHRLRHTSFKTIRLTRDLHEQAPKQLLHAKARWPEMVHLSLWPYALRNSAYVSNLMLFQEF